MRRFFPEGVRDERGLAAMEFGLVAPVLLLLLGSMIDFTLAFWNKGMLASAVAEGAHYAFVTGPGVSASAIQNIVGQSLSLPAADVIVTGPSCRCVSGTPVTVTAQVCGNPCPNGTTPGTYVTITARYAYASVLPFYSSLVDPVLVETATVRLK